jgi:hypothetical protein
MNILTTDIYKYLESLEEYAFGDLWLFHELSISAEQKEKKQEQSLESSTGIIQTTRKPSDGSYSSLEYFEPICRATIPFTLMIFSCMDILGYLVREKGSHTQTKENIRAFFDYVYEKPSSDEINCIINIFRHGLAHNYFPKLEQSISYHSTNPDLIFFSDSSNSRVILNVNKLEEYFTIGFESIKNTQSIYIQMEARFKKLNNYYEQHEKCKLISSLLVAKNNKNS